jgi:uncharacterized protein (TIGR02996 family)
MSVVNELIEAIAADPRDEGPQLVIADYLLSEDDPRGELIMLDRRERAGDLDDPTALDQLLLLAAQYSFPRAEPDDPLFAFARFDGPQPSYRLVHADRFYELYPAHDADDRTYLRIRFVDDGEDEWDYHSLDFGADGMFAAPNLDAWVEAHRSLVFQILSDAIHANTPFETVKFPFGPLAFPQYEGSPLRCYMLPVEFLRRHDLLRNQLGLAARDYYRWHRIWTRLRGMTRT